MKSLNQNLILQKNLIASPTPWLILIDVKLSDVATLRLVKNNEDIVFQSNTYTAFPFELDPSTEDSTGQIPTWTLKVSNVTRAIQAYLEELNGLVDVQVTITFANAAYLLAEHDYYGELQVVLDVLSTTSDAMWVTMTLGAANPLTQRFPLYRHLASHCNWYFNYTGMTNPEIARECNWVTNRKKWVAFENVIVDATVTPTTDNGHTYICTVAGITSSLGEPTWPTTTGATVVDGFATWKENGVTTSCKRTLEDCRRLANTKRYGGYAGLNNYGVRLA